MSNVQRKDIMTVSPAPVMRVCQGTTNLRSRSEKWVRVFPQNVRTSRKLSLVYTGKFSLTSALVKKLAR